MLILISLSSSGCILALAAAIRWDRKNYERQQRDKKAKEENKETDDRKQETKDKGEDV